MKVLVVSSFLGYAIQEEEHSRGGPFAQRVVSREEGKRVPNVG